MGCFEGETRGVSGGRSDGNWTDFKGDGGSCLEGVDGASSSRLAIGEAQLPVTNLGVTISMQSITTRCPGRGPGVDGGFADERLSSSGSSLAMGSGLLRVARFGVVLPGALRLGGIVDRTTIWALQGASDSARHTTTAHILYRLARWINPPTSGLELIAENIMRNHHVRSSPLHGRRVHSCPRVKAEDAGPSAFARTGPPLAPSLASLSMQRGRCAR